jgi:hypothetical protein
MTLVAFTPDAAMMLGRLVIFGAGSVLGLLIARAMR